MKGSVEFRSELLFFLYQRLRKGRKKEHSDQFMWSSDNRGNVDWWERCNFLRMGVFLSAKKKSSKLLKDLKCLNLQFQS